MMASVGPSPKVRKRSNTPLMEAMLAAIPSSVSIWRWVSLPDGSPTLVVPPPMTTIGRWPVCCNRRSIMTLIRLPMCRLVAVAS